MTEATRLRELMSTDRAALDALLDSTVLGHVGFVADDSPVVIPTAVVRDGDRLLMHGSTGSGWMRRLATGVPVSLAITALDGLVVARSAFESSMHYRSAVVFGRCVAVPRDDIATAVQLITERLIPGRTAEVRTSTSAELAATLVLALPIERWSLRISDGWPDDPESDVAGPAWAGVLPIRTFVDTPVAAPDLRAGIEVPASVRAQAGR